jgi:hypothetical protein
MNTNETRENYEDKNEETTSTSSGPSVEKKLGDLMMKGWVLMADSCPLESKIILIKLI